MHDLLLAIRGYLVDLDPATDYKIKANAFIAVSKDQFAFCVLFGRNNSGDLMELLEGEAVKKIYLG
jgi:hypothetical protein